jgi:hypothetical protein
MKMKLLFLVLLCCVCSAAADLHDVVYGVDVPWAQMGGALVLDGGEYYPADDVGGLSRLVNTFTSQNVGIDVGFRAWVLWLGGTPYAWVSNNVSPSFGGPVGRLYTYDGGKPVGYYTSHEPGLGVTDASWAIYALTAMVGLGIGAYISISGVRLWLS